MAELVSTLRITGSVNGKKINFTHTYTLEDVYDAGVYDAENTDAVGLYTGATAGGTQVTFAQNTPQYLLVVNRDSIGTSQATVTTTGGDLEVRLQPSCFVCLTGQDGLVKIGAGATDIDMQDVSSVTNGPVLNLFTGKLSLLAAFNSTT